MEAEVLIKAENVSKKFAKSLKKSLYYGVQDLISGITGRTQKKDLRKDEFWAVKDISFEVRRGECLGLIGHNGAGKSTLLKMLNGLIAPDEGTITIKGKIGALIELGAGFNPILSGRENIYNNAAVIGFTKKEIDAKLEAIIAFAELEEFIDMPVQNYSSGMKVRLGFAVAAQMEPDVLIIDEVLAVGDVGFRIKCLTRIGELLKKTAIIFVSHTMPQVARIVNKVLLLKKGQELIYSNDISEGIEKYYQFFKDDSDKILGGNGMIKLEDFKILDINNKILDINNNLFEVKFNSRCIFEIKLKVDNYVNNYWVNYSIIDKDAKQVANFFSLFSGNTFSEKGDVTITSELPNILLGQGTYTVGVSINEVRDDSSRGDIYYFDSRVAIIFVSGISTGHAPIQFIGNWKSNKL